MNVSGCENLERQFFEFIFLPQIQPFFPFLRNLYLQHTNMDALIIQNTEEIQYKLDELDLNCIKNGHMLLQILNEKSIQFKTLLKLGIGNNKITNQIINDLPCFPFFFKKLTELNLQNNLEVDEKYKISAFNIQSIVIKCKKLKKINIWGHEGSQNLFQLRFLEDIKNQDMIFVFNIEKYQQLNNINISDNQCLKEMDDRLSPVIGLNSYSSKKSKKGITKNIKIRLLNTQNKRYNDKFRVKLLSTQYYSPIHSQQIRSISKILMNPFVFIIDLENSQKRINQQSHICQNYQIVFNEKLGAINQYVNQIDISDFELYFEYKLEADYWAYNNKVIFNPPKINVFQQNTNYYDQIESLRNIPTSQKEEQNLIEIIQQVQIKESQFSSFNLYKQPVLIDIKEIYQNQKIGYKQYFVALIMYQIKNECIFLQYSFDFVNEYYKNTLQMQVEASFIGYTSKIFNSSQLQVFLPVRNNKQSSKYFQFLVGEQQDMDVVTIPVIEINLQNK
ncbi:hypothetical protein PPERSA_09822 [Pseudocohnilembus persalinus]|uniref:Uncharacterized protein n=1 Tax=Pseudocohnilembus persalinus TaxID=266149 RepID=A0A0V0QTU9_PSEPJ|nr:hypothetical protein PPERSA_09822 [Pseudocohnilembus persalinus]|eukprot:KRX05682.1 hypothetical protein PPERSA_09822 [Pseudocohnilembus persalinus]